MKKVPAAVRMAIIDFQKNNFAALSVGDILQYNLLPAALRNEFSESLYKIDRLIDVMRGLSEKMPDLKDLMHRANLL